MEALTKSLVLRFVRGFVAGAVGNMVIMLPFSGQSWKEVGTWLAILSLSGFVGGVSGALLTIDKYLRSE